MTGFNWMPRMRPPALQIYDLPVYTTYTTSPVLYARLPVYNTDWVEIVFTVVGNPVNIIITPDSTAGHMAQHVDEGPVGTYTCWVLVHGVPENVSTALGSHTVAIEVADATSGNHSTISAVVRMRVSRRT